MEQYNTANARVRKISRGGVIDTEDLLAVEEPLEIQVVYGEAGSRVQKSISVTMRTPGNDKELAAGFLFTEGLIKDKTGILSIDSIHGSNKIVVVLKENVDSGLQKSARSFYTTSSCGVCGKPGIDAIKTESVFKNNSSNIIVNEEMLYSLHDIVREQQAIFDSTGGLHASALFDSEGNFLLLREDVGRHNALDKLIGTCLSTGELPLLHTILFLSGRASFELIQKAAMAGIRIVVAVGAPSSLAVELANECGITLVGFLRNERFNIYAGEQRIRLSAVPNVFGD